MAAVASSARPMKVRPIPLARAPGVEKFHCRFGKISSLDCAAAVVASPTVAITTLAARGKARNLVIRKLLSVNSVLGVQNLRYFVLGTEPGDRSMLLTDAARFDL